MAIGIITCRDALDVEQLINSELVRTGWIEQIDVEDRTRANCIENTGIRFVDWVNNQVHISVYAPEYDY